jgi:hypothetical protein
MLIPKPMKGGKSSHVKVMLPGVFKVKKVAEFFKLPVMTQLELIDFEEDEPLLMASVQNALPSITGRALVADQATPPDSRAVSPITFGLPTR